MNRLIHESSPYLLQHADDPVDWYAWGDEAFAQARRQNKPIFLSIGYSTCHWCHVMHRESFQNEAIAERLNRSYIAIKVDREERPDIDQLYMNAAQAMIGEAGWPLTVVMTPQQVPYFIATYVPPESGPHRSGLMQLLPLLAAHHEKHPDKVETVGKQLRDMLTYTPEASSLRLEQPDEAFRQLMRAFDRENGGFHGPQKFPLPHHLSFLFAYAHHSGDETALQMALFTLTRMERGGIHDHLGGGYARYTVDARWVVPHFEKMLIDNALLSKLAVEAFQLTGHPRFQQQAYDVYSYVLREMTDADGCFYTAQDADSEGQEGTYYVWSYDEVMRLLGNELGELFAASYNVTPSGNFEGRNVLHQLDVAPDNVLRTHGLTTDEWRSRIEAAKEVLLEARAQRVPPFRDDKVLTHWNALMIDSLATAAGTFQDEALQRTAERAYAALIRRHGRTDTAANSRNGKTGVPAFLDDYAALLGASLSLYDASFDVRYLEDAKHWADTLITRFWDEEATGFFFSPRADLFLRSKEWFDGSAASGIAVATKGLIRLARLLGIPEYERYAARIFEQVGELVRSQPQGFTGLLEAFLLFTAPSEEIVLLGERPEELLRKLQRSFRPERSVLYASDASQLAVAPFTAGYTRLAGPTTAYVCERNVCSLPTDDLSSLRLR